MGRCRFYNTRSCQNYLHGEFTPTGPECTDNAGQYDGQREAGCVKKAREKNSRLHEITRNHAWFFKKAFPNSTRKTCCDVI